MYAAHVLLIHHGREICHAQSPAHDICPVRDRCRMVDRQGPLTASPRRSPGVPCGASRRVTGEAMTDLAAVLADLLATDFAASPVMALRGGPTEFDERLDDVSADAFAARDAYAAALLARLDAIADDGLTPDEAIDRDLARSVLRGRADPGPVRAVAPRSRDVLGAHHERPVHAVPAPPPPRGGPRRRRRRPPRAGRARRRRRASRTSTRRSPTRSSWSAGSAPRAARARYVRDLVWRDVAGPGRAGAAARGRRAGRARTSTATSPTSRRSSRRRTAAGSWARRATPGSCASARSSPTTPARCASAARRELERLDAEMAALARDATGNAGLRRGAARGRRATTRPRSARCSRPTPSGPRRRATSSPDTGLVTLPRGRDLRGRAVARVPAPGPRRGVVHRAAGVLGPPDAATSSSRSRRTAPPRRRSRPACRTTPTAASPRPRSTRRTRATTGTW